MKKQILLLIALVLAVTGFSQVSEKKSYQTEKHFSYSPDGKQNFKLSEEQIIIKFLPGVSFEQQANILRSESILLPLSKDMLLPSPTVTIAKTNGNVGAEELAALLQKLTQHEMVLYANPFLIYKDGTKQGITDRFIVKLRTTSDVALLNEMVTSNGLRVVEQYKYDRKVYIVEVPKAAGFNALEMANKFYESGKFSAAEPDFLLLLKRFDTNTPFLEDESTLVNTNDTFLDYQWSLNNTGSTIQYNGTPGSDMNVFNAWGISTGSASIKVAILDEGVDLVHPDLQANLLVGFDTTGLGSGGAPSGDDAHGTACAGIVAAVGNNNLGISGIAYNCKIIPIRIAYSNVDGDWVTTNSGIGTAIDWAWQTGGADVLSNSWGGGSSSSLINDAIDRAVTQGRGGLGAPVLFSAGNGNGAVNYPAYLPNVISVTAMSMCDQRKTRTSCDGETWWGSDYGTNTDVSAPGVKIYTTDISGAAGYSAGDYAPTFNGTSSACPNVAGVMALLLSANSSLSMLEAREIIESTCNKVGGYTYTSNVPGQPNGSWSTDLGYGRVNALAALQLAAVACTSPPFAGTAVASNENLCSPTNVSLSLNGIANFMDQTYQWQSSTNNSVWTSIVGATLITYNTIVSTSTYFRCLVTCTGNTSESISTQVNVAQEVAVVGSTVESICEGASISLSVTGATDYIWSPATGLNQTTGSTVIANPTETTIYSIVSNNVAGCTPTTSITVTVNPLPATPVVSANSPLNIGETLNLSAAVPVAEGYVLNSDSDVSFIDISATGSSIAGISDDSGHLITIPAFTFNTIEYTTALVSSNGFLVFGATATGADNFTNQALPTTSFASSGSSAGVCPYWDDLLPTTGTSITTETIGNIYIVQWNMIRQYSAGQDTLTFQIQLNITTGQINIVYPDVFVDNASYNYGASATIGLNYSTTSALQYSYNTASLQNGQSLTFTPKELIYSWTGPNNFTSDVQNPSIVNVAQNAAGTYTLQLTSESGCSASASLEVTVVGPLLTYYADVDGDGFGNSADSIESNTGAPAGYVLNSTDCDDTNPVVNVSSTPAVALTSSNLDNTFVFGTSVTFTATPSNLGGGTATYDFKVNGVSVQNTASNTYTSTTIANTQQVSVEMTVVDGGCLTSNTATSNTITNTVTQIVLVNFLYNCGGLSDIINPTFYSSTPDVGSSTLAYRFKITNTNTNTTVIVDRNVPNINLQQANMIAYSTLFTAQVAAVVDGVEQPYSMVCSITTPGVITISPAPNGCGGTLAAINSRIYVNSVPNATQYTYRVALASAPTTYYMFSTPFTNFRLTAVPGLPLTFETTYNVSVNAVVNGNPIGYGTTPCQYMTPRFLTTQLQIAQCGGASAYLVPSNSTLLYANFVSGATYTFKIEPMGGGMAQTITRPVNYFSLDLFSGLMEGTNYKVSVALTYFGSGPYGAECIIRTPGMPIAVTRVIETPFSAIAYPNPFATSFTIDVTTKSISNVSIKVYDMLGRLVEERTSKVTELETTTIGNNYPSGVYNILVTQDNDVSSVRMIKR